MQRQSAGTMVIASTIKRRALDRCTSAEPRLSSVTRWRPLRLVDAKRHPSVRFVWDVTLPHDLGLSSQTALSASRGHSDIRMTSKLGMNVWVETHPAIAFLSTTYSLTLPQRRERRLPALRVTSVLRVTHGGRRDGGDVAAAAEENGKRSA